MGHVIPNPVYWFVLEDNWTSLIHTKFTASTYFMCGGAVILAFVTRP